MHHVLQILPAVIKTSTIKALDSGGGPYTDYKHGFLDKEKQVHKCIIEVFFNLI
jgi:hypothetical protein